MPRTLPLLAACVAVATLAAPALADSSASVGVTYTTLDGTRQFAVRQVDGVTPLNTFTFGSDLQMPFRTIVTDSNRLLNSNGYQVNASMTNLYLATSGGHDWNTVIPSSALSLTYGANPLAGTSVLPVSPKVLLTGAAGVLGTCADPLAPGSITTLLGITPLASPLDAVGLAALSAPLANVCTQLAAAAAAPVSTLATGVGQVLDTSIPLTSLPFALTGAMQGGAFTDPSYQGVAAGDPARNNNPPAATSKRIMTGTSLMQTGASLTTLLSTLTTALHSQVDALPAVGGGGKVTLAAAEAALSSVQPTLTSALEATLDATKMTTLLNRLTATVQSLTGADLSTVSGRYDAYPVLTAAPVASKAGSYDGTLIVDFIETS